MTKATKKQKTGQSSFTLIETLIALGLMGVIILEVTIVQGRSADFSFYERKVTQGVWLAKGIMGEVEHKWNYFELKEVKAKAKEEKLPEELCPKDPLFDCDFKYSISIDEWKLPLIEMAAKSVGDATIAGVIKEQMKQILGDEVLKVANVEVSWGEGSRKDSVSLAYLMTAQFKLDKAIELIPPVVPLGEKPEKPGQQGGGSQGPGVPPPGVPPPGVPPPGGPPQQPNPNEPG